LRHLAVVDLAVIEDSQRASIRIENRDLQFGQPLSAIREGILRENPDLLVILGQRRLPAVAHNGHLQSGGKDHARLHRRNPQRDLPTNRRLVLRLNRPFAPRDDPVLNGESPGGPPGPTLSRGCVEREFRLRLAKHGRPGFAGTNRHAVVSRGREHGKYQQRRPCGVDS
jgi:hypothetical protein